MSEDLEMRRKRATWRATHRGTKELDLLIGRFADAHLEHMNERELADFEEFLNVHEPELQSWLLGETAPDNAALSGLVGRIRRFHGLS